MKNISFFKRRVMSAYIRAEQVAPYIGARLNPIDGYEDDVCIWIKQTPATTKWGERYVDVVDRHQCINWLKNHEDCGAIAISKVAEEFLKSELKNKVVFIPQQHCNFLREQRTRTEVNIVGFCGEYHTFAPFEEEIRSKLKKIGMELKFFHTYKRRQDVVDFYKGIDIQIVWRMDKVILAQLKNPLKLSSAGSFGIPTVAYPEPNFVAEYNNCFQPAETIDSMIDAILNLKTDPVFYSYLSEKVKEKAENYHIENVAKFYQELIK